MSELDGLYQELILDHAKHPQAKRELRPAANSRIATQHEFNPSCGDEIALSIAVDPLSHKITDIAWQGEGCAISMASASILAQLLSEDSCTVEQANARIALFRKMLHGRGAIAADPELLGDAVALEGVAKFVMRVKCAMLGWVALEAALLKVSAGGSTAKS